MKRTSPVSRSGRFAGGPAAAVAQFTESVSFDGALRQDIAGSMAMRGCSETPAYDAAGAAGNYQRAGSHREGAQGGQFRWRVELEDVHMNLEAALTRRTSAGPSCTPAGRATTRWR